MCGIVGVIDTVPIKPSTIEVMLEIIKHRGPDDRGVFVDGKNALGNVRLSIIDLTPDGHMPMKSPCKDLWITYNGEVYNYIELREELEKKGHNFKSKSDTEVVLHAYEEWGEKCLERFNGMFAFIIYDGKRFFCARDRFGIKPFYYYFDNELFIAASEIKAILSDDRVPRSPNDRLIFDYLLLGQTHHTEGTFFEGIRNLEPGHYMLVEEGGLKIKKWWKLEPKHFEGDYEKAIVDLKKLFEDSVKLRLRSDVPVGTSLSGGIDSSAVISVMRDMASTNADMHGFSAIFEGFEKNEEKYQRIVVEKKQITWHTTSPRPADLASDLKDFIYHQEEPTRSSSPFAHWMVTKLAHQNGVKVLLDGQGGDEAFAGYSYFFANRA